MVSTSEEALLQRLAEGDRAALQDFYDRYAGLVNGLARRILRDAADAEDVVQDVFVQVWRDAARFDRERGSAQVWVCMIARSRALDRLRRRKARREDGERPVEPVAASWEPVLSVAMRKALDGLPEEQRRPLELAYYEGLTQTEIAARLQAPLGTIKTRMRTALLKLRESLARRG
jgi:RNA polymerase sigma-70 factor (ECF subfamily)